MTEHFTIEAALADLLGEPALPALGAGPGAETDPLAAYRNRILHGDCIEVMRGMPAESVDFVCTDPPYGVDFKDSLGRTLANDDRDMKWLFPAFAQIYRVLKPDTFCVSFYGWGRVDLFYAAFRRAGFSIVGHFTAVKPYASNMRKDSRPGKKFLAFTHENAFLLIKGNPEKFERPLEDTLPWKYTNNHFHPTEKPLCTIEPLVRTFSQPGDLVLDPFCGSGTTAVAAAYNDRDYLGIELKEEYFRKADERLQAVEAELWDAELEQVS